MAIAVAYVAPGTQIPLPESATDLADIVASEFGGGTTTTIAGATTTTTGG
jgi:hypothetical protein